MSVVEVQIRTERFCEVVRNTFNSRALPSPTVEELDDLKGKPLEKIECVSCTFDTPSEGSGTFKLDAKIAFRYHDTLEDVRNAGSLRAAPTSEKIIDFKLVFRIVFDASLPQPPVLTYEALAFGILSVYKGTFPIGDLKAKRAAIEATEDIVAIRIGTAPDDSVHHAPVDRTGDGEWIQRVPGELVAETVRDALDAAIDAAVAPSPPPDPNKPWLPRPKPKKLEKGESTGAIWTQFPAPSVVSTGEIIAVDACPLFDVDISIALTLGLLIEFPDPNWMKTVASLSWDADSTWCDVWSTVLLGVPFGIGFHIGAEAGASDSILGKPLVPGQGFVEAGRSDDSITFQKISGSPPPPSRDFDRTHSEVTGDGFQTGGVVRPKAVGPLLVGNAIPATSGVHIDCNLRGVSMVFNPAQVVLRNASPGYIGAPPRVFLERTVFVPDGAWSIRTDVVNMADPHSTSPQTVLTFVDPPTGRLAPGTSTSVFLFTDFGARWVDLGKIPEVPREPPLWAERLMNDYCDSIVNPWGHGVTQLGWETDPLLDPDYDHVFEIDPVRLWTVGLSKLPESARIEFLAVGPDRRERLLGTVEGKRSAALQLVTDANETLCVRSETPFSAPAPTLMRSWMFPIAAHDVGFEPTTLAAVDGLVAFAAHDRTPRTFDARDVPRAGRLHARGEQAHPSEQRVTAALARTKDRGREAWSTPARLDKETIAVLHRGRVLIGSLGASRRVQ